MTTELVEFPLDAGGSVVVLVQQDDRGPVLRGDRQGRRLEQAAASFETALGTIRSVAVGVLAQLDGLTRRPDEVQVSFALALNASAGAVIAAAGSTAQLQVVLTWKAGPEGAAEASSPGSRTHTSAPSDLRRDEDGPPA